MGFNSNGILRCSRYAFMPNKLSLCGPDKNTDLFYYCVKKKIDHGLDEILREFQILYPYLKLIAYSNNISDPFDERVIEAYWIGNNLLRNITKPKLYNHLFDDQQLKRKLSKKLLDRVINKISFGAKPHHSFHVLNIWKRTGNVDIFHTLKTMDLCKISWGKVIKIDKPYLEIEYQPLVLENNNLKLGNLINHKILSEINNLSFKQNFKKGDWISFHWNFACEILNKFQIIQLKKYTQESIDLCMM